MYLIEKSPDTFGAPCVRVFGGELDRMILLVKAGADAGRAYIAVQCGVGEKVRGRLFWTAAPERGMDKDEIAERVLAERGLDPATADWEAISAAAF